MIQLNKQPGQKMLELGGGENPHPQSDINVDVRPSDKVHFTIDFDKADLPWPITSEEFDAVFSHFAIEHVTWRRVKIFVSEIFRVLKPTGKAIIVMPNTENQLRYILAKPEPDGDESCMLFGDQDYPENSHKSYWSPRSATKLFQECGFTEILIQPYGQLETDMCLIAVKPTPTAEQQVAQIETQNKALEGPVKAPGVPPEASVTLKPVRTSPNTADLSSEARAALFNRSYFNGGYYKPFYWDIPQHEITFQKIMERKPESVIELGCGRGYVLKRLEDAGIPAGGIDISSHCRLSRVASGIIRQDCCSEYQWTILPQCPADLAFSQSFLEYIPEEKLPFVIEELQRCSRRGLHGVTFEGQDDGTDPLRCTIKPREWWLERLPQGHEVVSKEELEQGQLPDRYLKGDGKVKLNIGAAWTMFHHGWTNIDIQDQSQFAQAFGYKFMKQDVRQGLPEFGTGTVDAFYCAHMLEHLTYREGEAFLKECRRVIRKDGVCRFIVPDAVTLMDCWERGEMEMFDELSETCANSVSQSGKLYALLHENHHAIYDADTLMEVLDKVGFIPKAANFRQTTCGEMGELILRETLDVLPSISLIVEAVPKQG